MKNSFLKKILLIIILIISSNSYSQFNGLIPNNSATHIAINNGNWSDASTWEAGQGVPGLSSIVIIPEGKVINYDVNSNAHVFAIRLDGELVIDGSSMSRKLIVDTFLGNSKSSININANS